MFSHDVALFGGRYERKRRCSYIHEFGAYGFTDAFTR